MIIALPSEHHDHLADALVRDLGFVRRHVDAPIRELLLELDPKVAPGVESENTGVSPRLSVQLANKGTVNPEEQWSRLLDPPHGSWAHDETARETKRMLDVLREWTGGPAAEYLPGDWVIVGADSVEQRNAAAGCCVAIEGRFSSPESTSGAYRVDHWIAPAGVVGEQEAIVAYVKSLRESGFPQEYAKVAAAHDESLASRYEVPTLVAVEVDLPPVGPKEGWSYNPETGESFQDGEPLPGYDTVLVMPGDDAENSPA